MRDAGDADSGAMASQAFTLVGRIMEGPKGPVKQRGQWEGNAADKVHSSCTWQPRAYEGIFFPGDERSASFFHSIISCVYSPVDLCKGM
ncbi:hypothetical protein SCLCIDRAFT_469967 [Scleroderma citrinum Foug A]|uniref:Uncharacterized protein n=1 Tax=Scleroderma citrinum Foug A TaxID=1036808 RepID=A0A0C2ZVG0_9AGAM|nr:hypothetical protein SCLCIDRAFT_469967 [Scleroderma citrinum Foug A]